MKHLDTRVQYTKSVLKKALLKLLEEKPVNRITVKEICAEAGINRGTFYLHYSSPDDLLKEVEDDFVQSHMEFFSPYITGERNKSLGHLSGLFRCMLESPETSRVLLGPNGDPQFLARMRDMIRESVLDEWQKDFPHYSREDLAFVFGFVFSGATNLLIQWEENHRGISVDELALRLDRLGHYCHLAIQEFHGVQ